MSCKSIALFNTALLLATTIMAGCVDGSVVAGDALQTETWPPSNDPPPEHVSWPTHVPSPADNLSRDPNAPRPVDPMVAEGFTLADDVELIDCDQTTGWSVSNPLGTGVDGALLTATQDANEVLDGSAALELAYPIAAGKAIVLSRSTNLASLQSMQITLRSQNDTQVRLLLGLADGTLAEHDVTLVAGQWKTVVLTPAILSPPRDVSELGSGIFLFDMAFSSPTAPPQSAGVTNTLWVDAVRVERPQVWTRTGEWIVDARAVVISVSARCHGDIRVENGGSLEITAGAFTSLGNVTVDNASLELSGTNLDVPQAYREQFAVTVTQRGRVAFIGGTISSPYPLLVFGLSIRQVPQGSTVPLMSDKWI